MFEMRYILISYESALCLFSTFLLRNRKLFLTFPFHLPSVPFLFQLLIEMNTLSHYYIQIAVLVLGHKDKEGETPNLKTLILMGRNKNMQTGML